jgi:hypothetical protein
LGRWAAARPEAAQLAAAERLQKGSLLAEQVVLRPVEQEAQLEQPELSPPDEPQSAA